MTEGRLPRAVIFDVGKVLYEWDPRYLYEKLIDDAQELDRFLGEVVTMEWHHAHDGGVSFAENSAALIARHPGQADLIRQFGPRFNETVPHPVPGMPDLVADLDAAGIPLFAITNFSGEFWPPFLAREERLFRPFRDIVVSGDERLAKPDPAIYRLALKRFGLKAEEALFIDDRSDNIAAAEAVGIHGHVFRDAPTLRKALQDYHLLPN